MNTIMDLAKVLFLILLFVSFLVLGIFTLTESGQLLTNSQNLVDQIKKPEAGGDITQVMDAIRLQKEVYDSVIKDVLSPLLNAIAAGFIAYVAGKAVGTVSYNLTEAKKGSGGQPKLLELL